MTTTTLLFVFVFLFLSSTSSSLTFAASKDATTTTFIRTCCNSTSYSSLCVKALSPYAGAVQKNPVHLALVATNVSLPYVTSAASKSSALYKRASPGSPAAKALRDCREVLGDALGNTKYSMSQIVAMKGPPDQRLWALSNAQTYMSAALTKEDTCVDGLKEMGTAAKSLRARVVKAEKYTSNALALLNRLRTYA